MIARIVPVKRSPRTVSVFDYLIPDTLVPVAQVGQLVMIELRKHKEFGVIVEILHEHNPEFVYKELDSIIFEHPLLPPPTQKFLTALSSLHATSLATIHKTALLPLQKRKLKSVELTPLTTPSKKTLFKESYTLYTTPRERTQIISSVTPTGTTLILVPGISVLNQTKEILETNCREHTIVSWHADLSDKEKFTRWLLVRNNKNPCIVIGTRSALTLPYTDLQKIIIDAEHNDQYKSYEQQPRFHARDMARILAQLTTCPIVYTSFSPSFEMYYRIAKNTLPCTIQEKPYHSGLVLETTVPPYSTTRIIQHIPQPNDKRVCAISTEEYILETARKNTEDIVILVQRKGFATLVVCKKCGHIETSKETGLPMVFYRDRNIMEATYTHEERALPKTCSACTSTLVLLEGIGDEKVAEYISKIFIQAHINLPVIVVDDETPEKILSELSRSQSPRVIVGTIKALSHIRDEHTGLFVILDIDRYLALPEYHALENTVHLLNEIRYRKKPESHCIIETTSNEKPLFKLFTEPDRVYRTELSIRKKLNLPPYTHLVKYTVAGPSKIASRKNAETFREILARRLTEYAISATVSPIFETHPQYHQRQYWHGMILTTPQYESFAIHAEKIHLRLPLGVVVDTNPTNTLSP